MARKHKTIINFLTVNLKVKTQRIVCVKSKATKLGLLQLLTMDGVSVSK